LSAFSTITCGTTTTSGRTEALHFARPGVSPSELRRARSRPPPAFGVGTASAAWFTSTTRSRYEVRVSEPNGRRLRGGLDGRRNHSTRSASASVRRRAKGDRSVVPVRSVPWCWRLPPVALLLNVPTGPEERTWLTSATSTTARPRSGRPSYQDLTRRADRACQLPVPDRTTRSAEHRGFC
jgi:hypothetical protein